MEDNNKLETLSLEYQKVRDQLQSLNIQKERLSLQKNEYDLAETEVSKSTGTIYSSAGSVMVETSKEEALKAITEHKEMIKIRLDMASKQGSSLADKEKQLREELESMLKGSQPQS